MHSNKRASDHATDRKDAAPASSARIFELAIRLSVLGLLVYLCFTLISPFLTVAIWSAVIAVALHPLYSRIVDLLNGRRKIAAVLLTLLTYLVVPIHQWLRSHVSAIASAVIIVVGTLIGLWGFALIIYGGIVELNDDLPRLIDRARGLVAEARAYGRAHLPRGLLDAGPAVGRMEQRQGLGRAVADILMGLPGGMPPGPPGTARMGDGLVRPGLVGAPDGQPHRPAEPVGVLDQLFFGATSGSTTIAGPALRSRRALPVGHQARLRWWL